MAHIAADDFDEEALEGIVFQEVAKQLEAEGFPTTVAYSEEDSYSLDVEDVGVFIVVDTQTTQDESSGDFQDVYLRGPDGEVYSASVADYFYYPADHVFDGAELIFVLADGSQQVIQNPSLTDFPAAETHAVHHYEWYCTVREESDDETITIVATVEDDAVYVDSSELLEFCLENR